MEMELVFCLLIITNSFDNSTALAVHLVTKECFLMELKLVGDDGELLLGLVVPLALVV